MLIEFHKIWMASKPIESPILEHLGHKEFRKKTWPKLIKNPPTWVNDQLTSSFEKNGEECSAYLKDHKLVGVEPSTYGNGAWFGFPVNKFAERYINVMQISLKKHTVAQYRKWAPNTFYCSCHQDWWISIMTFKKFTWGSLSFASSLWVPYCCVTRRLMCDQHCS